MRQIGSTHGGIVGRPGERASTSLGRTPGTGPASAEAHSPLQSGTPTFAAAWPRPIGRVRGRQRLVRLDQTGPVRAGHRLQAARRTGDPRRAALGAAVGAGSQPGRRPGSRAGAQARARGGAGADRGALCRAGDTGLAPRRARDRARPRSGVRTGPRGHAPCARAGEHDVPARARGADQRPQARRRQPRDGRGDRGRRDHPAGTRWPRTPGR
jgi:hypothetical protein